MSNGIITLCGSTRFKSQFEELKYWLTLHNYIYLSVGGYHHSETNEYHKKEIICHKQQLDSLHKEKIAMSDAIIVLDVDSYVGDSTKSEVDFAKLLRKPIFWYSNQSYLNLAVTPLQIRQLGDNQK